MAETPCAVNENTARLTGLVKLLTSFVPGVLAIIAVWVSLNSSIIRLEERLKATNERVQQLKEDTSCYIRDANLSAKEIVREIAVLRSEISVTQAARDKQFGEIANALIRLQVTIERREADRNPNP